MNATSEPRAPASPNGSWDRPALWSGAMVALVFAVPFSLAASWAAGARDDSGLAVILSLGAVFGFVLGGGCAAWSQRVGLPLKHSLVAAIGTYVVAQTFFVALALARETDVNLLAALFNLSVVAVAGLVGGVVGGRMRARGFVPSSQR